MGLKNTFQKAAQNTLKAFGDIPEVAYIFRATAADQPTYNPATATPATAGTSYLATNVAYDKFSEKDVDGDKILSVDELALIPSLNVSITPMTDDILTKIDLSEWVLKAVKTDPAKALYICQIRPTII